MSVRSALLAVPVVLVAAACGGGPTPTASPPPPTPTATASAVATPTATASAAPTANPATLSPATSASPPASGSPVPASPGASLDPSQSDAGIVGRVTVTNDTRAARDGTYDIVGVAANGSSCEVSFAGDEYSAIAANESVPEGQLDQMSVDIPFSELPTADGEQKTGIIDGRATFSFAGGFVGTQYTGEPTQDDRTTATINVTRQGAGLVFDYEGTTWDAVSFAGQLICADGGLGG